MCLHVCVSMSKIIIQACVSAESYPDSFAVACL